MKFPLLFLLVLATVGAQAQLKKKIKQGRRNKSESQVALAKNDFLAEWEAGHETISSDLGVLVYPNLILHYALSDRMEINTEMNLVTVNSKAPGAQKKATGIEPVFVGVNYLLVRDTDTRPAVMLTAQLALPFLASASFKADHLGPALQVNAQQSLWHRQGAVGLSSGLFWDGFTTTPTFTYNANFSYLFLKKWMVTAESFGFVNQDLPQHNLDASLAYQLNNYTQFGMTVGFGISSAAHKNYFALNGSWGLNTGKKPKHG